MMVLACKNSCPEEQTNEALKSGHPKAQKIRAKPKEELAGGKVKRMTLQQGLLMVVHQMAPPALCQKVPLMVNQMTSQKANVMVIKTVFHGLSEGLLEANQEGLTVV